LAGAQNLTASTVTGCRLILVIRVRFTG